MAGSFTVTPLVAAIRLDAKGQGAAQFNVANNSGRQLRGRARLVAQDPTQQAWFTLVGEAERDFAPGAAEQYSVTIQVAPAAKAGDYSLRLDMIGVDNPDDDLSQGPPVSFTVAAPAPTTPPSKPQQGFPIWIPITAGAALLLIAAIIGFVALSSNQSNARIASATATAGVRASQTALAIAAATQTALAGNAAAAAVTNTALSVASATQTAAAGPLAWVDQTNLFFRQATYSLRLTGPGEINVSITQSEVNPLRVLIVGPDGVVAAQANDTAPFTLAYAVTAANFSAGAFWEVDIIDPAADFQHANGSVTIQYPSGSRMGPFTDTFGGVDPESEHTNVVVAQRPGRIQASAEWSSAPQALNLGIYGSDPTAPLAVQTGGSPLSTGFTLTAAMLAVQDTYKVHLYNSTDSQSAQVKVTVSAP